MPYKSFTIATKGVDPVRQRVLGWKLTFPGLAPPIDSGSCLKGLNGSEEKLYASLSVFSYSVGGRILKSPPSTCMILVVDFVVMLVIRYYNHDSLL